VLLLCVAGAWLYLDQSEIPVIVAEPAVEPEPEPISVGYLLVRRSLPIEGGIVGIAPGAPGSIVRFEGESKVVLRYEEQEIVLGLYEVTFDPVEARVAAHADESGQHAIVRARLEAQRAYVTEQRRFAQAQQTEFAKAAKPDSNRFLSSPTPTPVNPLLIGAQPTNGGRRVASSPVFRSEQGYLYKMVEGRRVLVKRDGTPQ